MKNILIIDKKILNIVQTLECGQIFSFEIMPEYIKIFSGNNFGLIINNQQKDYYEVYCTDKKYFENFFDMQTNYIDIKKLLCRDKILIKPVHFGEGIRILKQDILETIISFAISANNNIKRIKKSIALLREFYGTKNLFYYNDSKVTYYSFPTLEKLNSLTLEDWLKIGVGYRAPQILKLIQQLNNINLNKLKELPTEILRNELIKLSGIGPKVADCILLFAFHRMNVFPVDTWIEKVYNNFFGTSFNRAEIRNNLIKKYGNLSGYAQQFLFYYGRSLKIKNKD